MGKFLEKCNLPILNEVKVGSLNRRITASEIEAVIKKLSEQRALDQTVSQENFTKHLRKR